METIPIPKNFKDLINQMKNLGNIKIKQKMIMMFKKKKQIVMVL